VKAFCSDIGPGNFGILDDDSVDVFFVALHGTFGEDGQLQEVLENRDVVYTGSGPRASRIAFDKMATKRVFEDIGILTPSAVEFRPSTPADDMKKQIADLGGRLIVKPVREGSTIGVSIVDDADGAIEAARRCFDEFGDCMIEQYIAGREMTVGVLEGRALPLIEIRPKGGFYDYDAKYVANDTEYLFDTVERADVVADMQKAAVDCFKAIGCTHMARVDFMLADDGRAYALEINTIPGMTSHSLLPKAAARIGMPMGRLCLTVVNAALAERSGKCMVDPAVSEGK
jgi:D-alanine-D-alanine ligase